MRVDLLNFSNSFTVFDKKLFEVIKLKNSFTDFQTVYNTDIYVRLSREDGDKTESDSIINQQELIKEYLSKKPELRINQIRIDDGYTGVNFQRPAFQAMLEDVKAGKVNCIVVKDLSRFGRNYIEVGKYITNIFPFLGVRFIAINDNLDTADMKNSSELIFVHFKNLMNDAYCSDISVKTRSSLNIKQKNGDYTGAYAAYGYIKSEFNKNKLVVDETVRGVIENIFKWKLEGMSALRISDKLNSMGICSPLEHKKELHINYKSSFKKNSIAKWNATSVIRILKNRIYTGVLEQGKTSTPNYKVKIRILKPQSEWNIKENCIPAIISERAFNEVQHLLEEDTRVAPNKENIYAFSGILKCAECGANLTRKIIPSNGKKFVYYVCINHKNKKGCGNKAMISEKKLENIVLSILNVHIQQFCKMQELLKYISELPLHTAEVENLKRQLAANAENISKNKRYILELYEDLKTNLINEKDYHTFKQIYTERIDNLTKQSNNITKEINVITADSNQNIEVFKRFASTGKITELTRKTVVSFINNIYMYDKDRIEIVFKFEHEYNILQDYISRMSCHIAPENKAEVI